MSDDTPDKTANDLSNLTVGGHRSDPEFFERVNSLSGQNVSLCYQCGECTAGCPTAFAMDFKPNQVSRLVQLGMAEEALSCNSIWICVGCETCATRCPKNVDLCAIMDALRQMASKRHVKSPETDVQSFHEVFLSSIRKSGRMHEAGLIAALKLKTGKLTKDIPLGLALLKKGRLNPLPDPVKDKAAVQAIFGEAQTPGEDNGRQ
ncbi:MAG: 4Fe-4S dicluster domain-containing protein [Armatimonadetes bacterium]|nr:4Fe-4S dicluster domain-containing protein [Armatimonadota bacterium]